MVEAQQRHKPNSGVAATRFISAVGGGIQTTHLAENRTLELVHPKINPDSRSRRNNDPLERTIPKSL